MKICPVEAELYRHTDGQTWCS